MCMILLRGPCMLVQASPYTRFKFSNNRRLYRDTMPLNIPYEQCSTSVKLLLLVRLLKYDIALFKEVSIELELDRIILLLFLRQQLGEYHLLRPTWSIAKCLLAQTPLSQGVHSLINSTQINMPFRTFF